MRGKSNRKEGRFEARTKVKEEYKRQRLIAYSIVFSGAALFIWGILLFDKTFISVKTQLLITLFGAAIGIIVFYFLGRPPYCFIAATNYFFRDGKKESIELIISEVGNHPRRRSKCRTLYAVVQFQNVQKSISFDCTFEKTIPTYRSMTLAVSRGIWGYFVYTNAKLTE